MPFTNAISRCLKALVKNISLRPVRACAPLIKEKGVWVFRTGQPLSASATDAALREMRDDRERQNFIQN